MNKALLYELCVDLVTEKYKDLSCEELSKKLGEEFEMDVSPADVAGILAMNNDSRDRIIHNRLMQIRYE